MTEANLLGGYIRHPSEPTPNRVTEFVRDITLETVPEHAHALISAETRYHMWINSREVVRDGGLFRESRPGCGWADKVDLAPYLRVGANRIYILLYYFGNGGRNNKRLPSDGLAFDCAAIGVNSDSGFLCRLHPAYYTPGEPRPSYLYGGDNLGYDARLDDGIPAVGHALPEGFVEPVRVDAGIFGKSYLRPIPLFRVTRERDAVVSDAGCAAGSTDANTSCAVSSTDANAGRAVSSTDAYTPAHINADKVVYTAAFDESDRTVHTVDLPLSLESGRYKIRVDRAGCTVTKLGTITPTEPDRGCADLMLTGREFTASLPWAAWVYPVLYIDGDGGEVVSVRTDRYEVPGGPGDSSHTYRGHRLEFRLKSGENRVEGLIPLYGEHLIVSCDRAVRLRGIRYRETGYNTDLVGSFTCDDEVLNRLVKKAARTLYVCMRDNFMDCPDRERGQWIGDVSVQIPQAAFLLDERAMLLAKKAILDFVNLRHGDLLVGNVPGEHSSELPSQSLAAISEWGLAAQYLRYTGDLETLAELFEPALRYLALWETDERGLVSSRKGSWQWYDHLYNCDGEVIENAWYLSALKFVRRLGELLGRTCDDFVARRVESISAGIERYWRGSFYSSDGRLCDDRANALCVLAGVCPPERYPLIRQVLLSVYNSSIYMENYVLVALCEMGYLTEAKRRMTTRYYNLAMNENSTLWEDFNILGTRNHAWSGAPATLAFRYFMGIDIDRLSGKLTLSPALNLYDQIECTIPQAGTPPRAESRV